VAQILISIKRNPVLIGSLIVTSAAALIIHAAGWARGPSFSSAVTPIAELIAAIVVGALVGAVIAVASSRAKADPQESEKTRLRSSSTDH
jgi:ethanolamine transporter EutH